MVNLNSQILENRKIYKQKLFDAFVTEITKWLNADQLVPHETWVDHVCILKRYESVFNELMLACKHNLTEINEYLVGKVPVQIAEERDGHNLNWSINVESDKNHPAVLKFKEKFLQKVEEKLLLNDCWMIKTKIREDKGDVMIERIMVCKRRDNSFLCYIADELISQGLIVEKRPGNDTCYVRIKE